MVSDRLKPQPQAELGKQATNRRQRLIGGNVATKPAGWIFKSRYSFTSAKAIPARDQTRYCNCSTRGSETACMRRLTPTPTGPVHA
jgi:hypothetical protein